jgi:hypothetical protein
MRWLQSYGNQTNQLEIRDLFISIHFPTNAGDWWALDFTAKTQEATYTSARFTPKEKTLQDLRA